jgi:hypothetical protein
MNKKINKKNIGLGIATIILLMQFFTIDKTQAEVDPAKDLIAITEPSDDVISILKTSCYNCHSDETEYPWYSNIAPVSWWIKDHIEEAKGHLNFSIWGDYSLKKQDHKLDEVYEEVEEGEMPLPSYTWIHSEANLSSEQREELINWVKDLREDLSKSM